MSLISVFVDAFKKAAGSRKPKIDKEDFRSSGPLGPSADTGAFTPQRTAPPLDLGSEANRGHLSVASADPEEGGEVTRLDLGSDVNRGDLSVASADPEEGGEVAGLDDPPRVG